MGKYPLIVPIDSWQKLDMASTAQRINPETTTPTRHPARPAIAATFALFEQCRRGKNPALSFARATSKVQSLVRRNNRTHLFWLVSALNEEYHAIVAHRCGESELAAAHLVERDRNLRYFHRAIARLAPGPLPETPAGVAFARLRDAVVEPEECEDNACAGCAWCDRIEPEDFEVQS